jgi:hypothetical protein
MILRKWLNLMNFHAFCSCSTINGGLFAAMQCMETPSFPLSQPGDAKRPTVALPVQRAGDLLDNIIFQHL